MFAASTRPELRVSETLLMNGLLVPNQLAPAVFYHGKYNQHILAMSLLAKEHVAYHGLAT